MKMKTKVTQRGGRFFVWLALALLVVPAPVLCAADGQATGKRQHKPIRFRAYIDAAVSVVNFDGAGIITLLDAETGAYSIASETSPNTFTWTSTRASGVRNVTSASIGGFLDPNRPALAVTSPEANRVNLLSLDSLSAPAQPVSVFLPSLGPNLVAAVDIGGPGNTAHEDLFIASQWNGSSAHRSTTLRNSDGAAFTPLQDLPLPARTERANPLVPEQGAVPAVGVIRRGASDTFVAYRFDSGLPVEVLTVPGLPSDVDWDWGHFNASLFAQLIFYAPGGTSVRYAVIGPAQNPAGLTIESSGLCLETAAGVATLTVVGDPIGFRLLVVEDGGRQATLHNFNGANLATLAETLAPPSGELFLGAIALGTNGFMMFTTPAEDGSSGAVGRHHVYRPQVNGQNVTYALASSGAVPQFGPISGTANVFQYRLEPFVHPVPNLLRRLSAGDWSSQFTIAGGPPVVSVFAETFVSALLGLDQPTAASLGAPHPQTQFGGVNQYTEFISLGTFTPAVGDEVSDVTILPPPGLFERAISVSFTTADPAHQIFYRVNGAGNWTQFTGTPLTLFANATVHYYARPPAGDAKSTVRTARYEFTMPPGSSDSDRDGVPDFVEAARGLDPARSGADGDGDGFSDQQELLEDTSPTNAMSHPAGQPGFEQHAAFDLVVTPRPLDGVVNAETSAAVGTLVRLFDLSGSLLSTEIVTNPPVSPTPASAVFRNVRIDARDPLLLLATEPHFDVDTPGADKRIGREMIGLVSVPTVAAVTVNYTYGSAGGDPAAEAAAWIAAAQVAFAAGEDFPPETVNFTYGSLGLAVLFERSLLQYLAQRGFDLATNGTLFSFRPSDVGRAALPIDLLLASEASNPTLPLLPITRRGDRAAIIMERSNHPEAQPFLALAHEVYRLSSESNNAAPGVYGMPLDVLREFVAHGPPLSRAQHEIYMTAIRHLQAALPEAAFAAVNYILAGVTARPVTNLALRLRSDSFTGSCTTLETTGLPPVPVRLVDAVGLPFRWPDVFAPIPGSVIELTGYADATSAGCPGFAVEVIQAMLASVPAASDGDLNDNLLLDSWEKLFLGLFGADPFGDLDGDGFQNLQEMLEGSDPTDGQGLPAAPPANLNPPLVNIDVQPGGQAHLEWTWPAAYAGKVNFSILATGDLSRPLAPVPLTPVHLGNGQYEATLPNPGAAQQFYAVRITLR